ncbi:hypothetical protein [Burkholderia multivorans]|uniref:hypothetical protein n=1 Tax=Burkholderia multivorans TaxID=87883 RepID=UPI001C25F80F|nr:hypothetical protein [Burkholderia multivorans]MBU9597071.1 hypothetical protein [Burkholderia multivorans]MDN7997027.1 hypothetical protein [Burkholderia multivorans]WVN01569.1 hypothetical protein V1241_21380 [Burkholderia multivorans]
MPFENTSRDRVYTRCARAVSEAGSTRESLYLARLALLLFETIGDETSCLRAIDQALANLPEPSLSAPPVTR